MSGAEAPFVPEWFGSYLAIDRLGRGAMGEVLLARPAVEGAPPLVVLKRLHADLTGEEAFAKRFRHEAEIATAIDSPRIVRVLDAGRAGRSLYIAMEHVTGWTLQRLLAEVAAAKRRPSLASAVEIVSGILEGLLALHSVKDGAGRDLGVVHRDLAPKNVMIRPGGQITIIDLGLGKSKAQDWKTRTGTILGSPGYMAPEQARAGTVDHRADLYAAAVMLYELASVKPYIPRGNVPEMLARALMPETLDACDQLPPDLARVLRRGLAVDPDARFASAREMLDALHTIPIAATADPLVLEIVGRRFDEDLERAKRRIADRMGETDADLEHTEVIQPPEVFSQRIQTMPFAAPPTLSASPRQVAIIVIASSALMFGLGMAIERMRSPSPAPAPIARPLEARRAVADSPVLVVPRPAAPESTRVPDPPAPRGERRDLGTPAPPVATPDPAPDPSPDPPPVTATLEERVDRMIDRASVSMRSLEGPRKEAARELLQRLTRQRSSPRLHAEVDRVEALEREVEALP